MNAIPSPSGVAVWTADFAFHAHALRRMNPVPHLLEHIGHLMGVSEHQGTLHTILMELYNNALDHGVLQLDSRLKSDAQGFMQYYEDRKNRLAQLADGYLKFTFTENWFPEKGAYLDITIQDSGQGYAYEEATQLPSQSTYCGRGLVLLRHLCEEVVVYPPGNQTWVRYALHLPAE